MAIMHKTPQKLVQTILNDHRSGRFTNNFRERTSDLHCFAENNSDRRAAIQITEVTIGQENGWYYAVLVMDNICGVLNRRHHIIDHGKDSLIEFITDLFEEYSSVDGSEINSLACA